jgi:hypothetical protein
MRLLWTVAVIAATWHGLAGTAKAEFLGSPADCATALRQDVVVNVSSAQQQYAYLSTIDEAEFRALRTNARASATIPIVDALVKASADYGQFQERRRTLFTQVGYSSSSAQSAQELRLTTSPAAYAAFNTCMAEFSRRNVGFHAWKAAENADVLVVNYYYQPPPDGRPLRLGGTVVNGEVAGAPRGLLFPSSTMVRPNSGGSVTVQRRARSGEVVTTTIEGAGYTGTTIESAFAPAPRYLGYGDVQITTTSVSTVDAGDVSVTSGQTRNNNEVRCRGGDQCSPDGKYRADVVDLRIPAQVGTTLSNPRLSCQGRGCPWVGTDRLVIEPDGSAHGILRTYSHPTVWTLTARAMRSVSSDSTTFVNQARFQSGGIASFLVPDGVRTATIILNIDGQNIPMQPGSNSPDGSLTFLGAIPPREEVSSGPRYYVYRVR